MKLEEDFQSMFHILDRTKKGFLSSDEIEKFFETLFFQKVDPILVNAVLRNVCGGLQCQANKFQEVLLKLEEWRQIELNCYWDFMAFNVDGSMKIALSSALLLARSVKGDKFSLETFNQWKATLHNEGEVSWEQFKQFLYFQPGKPFRNEAEFSGAVAALSNREAEVAFDEYQFYKTSMETDENYSAMLLRDKQQYQEDLEYHSSRLVNRWNVAGVEAVIHDDGTDMENIDNSKSKDDVTITELMSAIDEKYDILRSKLMWEMVRAQSENESLRSKVSQADVQEHFNDVQSKEKDMRKNGTLEDDAVTLYGGNLSYNWNLAVLMGDTADAYHLKWEQTEKRYKAYQQEGKTSDQIREIFEKENLKNMKNSATTSGNLLIELWKRQQEDKQYLEQKLKSAASQPNAQAERIALFTSLYRQCERAQEGANLGPDYSFALAFNPSASGVAVSERKQTFQPTRFSEDSVRQERLSMDRIKIAKQQQKLQTMPEIGDKMSQISQTKDLGTVASWMEITKLLEVKYEMERDMMMYFLHQKVDQHKTFSSLNEEDFNSTRNKLGELYSAWKQNMLSKSLTGSDKMSHLNVLHDAAALVQEFLRKQRVGKKDSEISATLLAQLQILQDVQYQELVEAMKSQNIEELYRLRKSEYRIVRDLHLDNIATLLFYTAEEEKEEIAPTPPIVVLTKEEEQIRDVIQMKYDVLRSKLWSEVAKSMKLKSGEDTKSAIKRLIEEEKSTRNKTDEQKALFDKLNIMYSSHDLLGPLASAFRTAASQNSDAEKMVTLDEAQLLDHEETNIITDLERRCDDEIRVTSEVVTSSSNSGARALAEVAKQKWMTSMIDSDVTFASSAVDLVTFDRYWAGKDLKAKLRQDLRRQVRSAQDRFQQENPFNEKPFQEFDLTNHKATSALQLLSNSYPAEWTKFRNLLCDVTAQELREASLLMTSDERVTRLAEINAKRRKLDIGTEDGKEDLLSLLEEGSALKHVSRQEILRQLAGEASDEDVGISLLADLQEEQLKDAIKWFERVTEVDTRGSTSPADEVQTHMDLCENIFAVLCKYEGLADDEHLLQALEDKYDALRDKVLMEALMRQLGEDEWNRMSEKERQARLMKLKIEERRLRRKGKYDELAKLLGDAFANEKKLKGLMGLSREEYERRLKERLEARKRGDVIPEEDEESLEEESGINNPLVDLTSRFEDERDALMRLLNGQDDLYLSEKERQRELVRLRQARLRAIEEERYESAAIVSGLIDREAKNRERLKSDKERQRELARRRLEEMRKKRSGKMVELGEEDAKIVDVEDRDLMEEAVLKKLHAFFNWERSWMSSALVKMSDPFEEKEKTSTITIRHRLSGISDHVPRGEVVLQDYYSHLVDAAFYRQVGMSIREEELRSRGDLDAALLAELQEIQDAAEAKLTSKMPDMSNEDLVNEQKRIVSLFKAGKSRNVPESVLTADFGGNPNREIVDALKSQFDAIIDVIAARVLPLKVGENNWEKMSRDEREAKIAHLSSSVKELIEAGRYDDALALLGDGLTDEEKKLLMSLLLGDAEERRKADEAERMARKRERMSDGMSKVDALELFKEEAERFEEQEKKRRKNVLEGLVSDFNNERDALLLALKQARDQAEADKRRQAYLTKLRLQERKLRRENDLSSVAHLLALSRIHDNAMDKEKQRQLALARERLEAYKRRKEAELSEEKEDSSELNLSSDDVTVLADAVLREMEAKHADERKTLMQILESTAPDSDIRQRADKSSSAERRERVKDLREMRRQWRNEDPQTLVETRDEQMEILKEASALQLSSLSINKKLTEADMEAYILADLQNVQRNEENVLLDGLLDKTAVVLRKLAQVQRQARADGWCDNVAGSLLGLEDAHQRKEEEEEVLRALEDKYDLLKDKLLAEALMKRLGESEWKNLSEQERQRRITQIKMQEKKLRRQGKHDDVAKLFRMLAINEKDVSRLFGEQKSSQQEDLKKRIAELIAERKKQGLSVEDDAIEKALEDEERLQRKTRKNVLLTLDRNLESEREALLASLRRQDEAISEERRRQLAVARLRRDRRQMEAEEKYSAVALVFQSAKQDEAALSASFEESRKRQHELAKARLSARRAQRKRKEAMAALTDPKKILEKLEMIAQEKKQGPPAERLLTAIAMKHEEERETLMLILLAAEDGPDEKNAKKMNDEKLKDAVEEFRTKRKAWRQDRLLRAIKDGTDRILTDEERKRLSNYVAEENKQMVSTVAVLLESKRRAGDVQGDVTKDGESTSIEWLAQLQHTQENEAKFTSEVIAEKSDEYLDVLTDNQRRSRREGWNDNIGKVVFNLDLPWQEAQRPASAGSLDQEAQESLQKMEDEMGRAEEDLEKEKQEIERKKAMGEDIDTDAEFSKLEKQYEARKALLSSDMEKQKAKIREKLMERRQRKDESEFEAHAAAGMVLLADERMKSRDARSKEQATKQRSLMEERLAARREKRRQEQEKLAQEIGGAPEESQTERESKPNTPLGGDRPATLAVPEVDKDKVVAELMRASRIISEQAARDRQRHLEQVRSRIRNKKDKKQSEAVQFIQAYQSEKTILDMRESMRISRQKTMLSERVEKLKTERTMTMKEGGKKKATDFSNLVDKKEVEGLDEDDRMTRIAEKLQKKLEQEKKDEILKEEEEAASTSRQLTMVFENVDADPIRPRTSSRKFEKSDKDQILKERMQRRKNKRERDAASVDPDKDDS